MSGPIAKPDGSAPTNWLSVFGGPAWEWDSVRKQYYLHNFLASQPDLNFHNPRGAGRAARDGRFWLDRGVDGFRLDTVNYYFHDKKLRDNPPLRMTQERKGSTDQSLRISRTICTTRRSRKTSISSNAFARCWMSTTTAPRLARSATAHAR